MQRLDKCIGLRFCLTVLAIGVGDPTMNPTTSRDKLENVATVHFSRLQRRFAKIRPGSRTAIEQNVLGCRSKLPHAPLITPAINLTGKLYDTSTLSRKHTY